MNKAAGIMQGLRAPLFIGAVVFVMTAIASIPASTISFFVDHNRAGLSYREAQGTIWRGDLTAAAIGGVPLGDVSYELSLLSLLGLSPELNLSANGPVNGRAIVSVGLGRRVSLRDVDADINLGAIAVRGLLGEPASGQARIAINRIDFSAREGCIKAEGELWTNALDAPAKRYDLPGLPMNGAVSCRQDKLVVSLAGENVRTAASIELLIDKSLAYVVTATATPSEGNIASALRVYGFEDDNGALTYGSVGMLTGAGS